MRIVTLHMTWSETIDVEVPDDWPLVKKYWDLPDGNDVRPFDPYVESCNVDDDGPKEEEPWKTRSKETSGNDS